MLGLDQLTVTLFINNDNIRYIDNGYLNGNVLHLHYDTYKKLGDMYFENENFNMWEWCYNNLNIIQFDNSIEFDQFIIQTEKSDTFAYHNK